MKKIIFLPIVVLLFSCANPENPEHDKKLKPYKNMLAEYEAADSNFGESHYYYRMLNFDLNSLSDTIAKVHEDIFKDEKIRALATKDISNWLRDSVFITSSGTKRGSFILDSINMLTVEKPLEYYLHSRVKHGQDVNNKIFQNFNSMHTVKIGDKKIFYYFIPKNEKLLKEVAEYRIETTGDYSPYYIENKATIYNRRYLCDLYSIDWYIKISSDDFFNDRLALKITDTTYYYNQDSSRQKN